ncbi:MAG: phosphotransferase [Deltaproteobacteria bacterium]|nr:phosphotransferase [Deltaproteobacteria bacterium]
MDSEKLRAGLLHVVKAFLKDQGFSCSPISIQPLAGDGSRRRFYRIHLSGNDFSCVIMENSPASEYLERENMAYLRIGQHLGETGLPIPKIYRFDLEEGWFIMEDVGDTNLQNAASGRKDRLSLYQEAVQVLFRLQTEGVKGFDRTWTCQTESYDRTVMRLYESDYFRDEYLTNFLGLKRDWSSLEGPFQHLAEMASKAGADYLMHRDFQSRNIFIKSGKIKILDWQGARLGPLAYDLASLLIDPYVGLSGMEKIRVYNFYLDILSRNHPRMVNAFEKYFPYLAIQRNLQILGAFSYLSLVEKKTHFEPYIPRALDSLKELLTTLGDKELTPLLELLEALPG